MVMGDWSFLLPWCEAAFGCLRYAVDAPGATLQQRRRGIQVHLPPQHLDGSAWAEPESESDVEYASRLCELRDALSLLAAVAHVDNGAWRELLVAHCGLRVQRGKRDLESTFAPRFELTVMNSRADSDGLVARGLALFCGAEQHATHRSRAYQDAMARINAIARERERGKAAKMTRADSTEVEVPISVQLDSWLAPASKGAIEYIRSIHQTVRDIRAEWGSSVGRDGAPFRVTFVLESIGLDFPGVEFSAELAQLVESLARDGVKCSGVSFLPQLSDSLSAVGAEGKARQIIARLLAGLFGGSRRSEAAMIAAAAGWGDACHSEQLVVDSVHWDCDAMRSWIFERMCSAVAVSQTTTNLSLMLDWVGEEEEQEWGVWRWRWQWIVFACFSQRARLFSRLEGLVLDGARITEEDVETIAAVLAAKDPEESLLGYQAEQSESAGVARAMQSTDLCIKAKAPLRFCPMHADEIPDDAGEFTVEKELAGVKLLRGGHESGWVDVLVPGFGKCQTLRTSLVRRAIVLQSKGLEGVTTLTLKFAEDPEQEVLHNFLTLIGASLKYLALKFASFNTRRLEDIVESCPNLLELAVFTDTTEMRFCLGGKKREDPILPSTLDYDFRDIRAIALALSSKENPLAKYTRRLRARFGSQVQAELRGDFCAALLRMLQDNRRLEYLDVFTEFPDMSDFEAFKAHHLEPLTVTKATLPSRCKLAFLSVMQRRRRGEHEHKMSKSEAPERSCHLSELNQPVVELIFTFAAVPMTRKVYFQEADYFETGRYYVPI